jgi:hypothetical protein
MATANYVLLQRITLTANASSVAFSSIPGSGYTDLKILVSARKNTSGVDVIGMAINGGSTAIYTNIYCDSNNSGTPRQGAVSAYQALMQPSDYTASAFGSAEINVHNYTASQYKHITSNSVLANNASAGYVGFTTSIWPSNSPITSISFSSPSADFVTGSTFALYGLADANTIPLLSPKADGGDIIKSDGTYWYHAFLSTATFRPQVNLNCDYVVVGGGGGGGSYYHGAGGGAGGLRAITNQSVAANSFMTVTVGAGGAGGISGGDPGKVGGVSTFNSFSASGGGGGGSTRGDLVGFTATAGGSGGGAPSYNSSLYGAGNSGSYSPVEGYAGGTAGGSGAPYYGSGGGGGASAVGSNGSSTAGGAGGAGTDTYNSINFSTWLTATGTGSSSKLAGGGGGSAYDAGSYGAGGVGGGGRGANQAGGTSFPVAGTAGTGGGGGGAERSNAGIGANGGSGLVIIRYPV